MWMATISTLVNVFVLMETPVLPLSRFGLYFERSVYEPAEDTFLLLDALESDLENIRSIRPRVCLEIGCGNGSIITALMRALSDCDTLFIATDVNEDALLCTQECVEHNLVPSLHSSLNLVQTNLADGVRLSCSVDVIVFNPPYVPTPSLELKESQGKLSSSWAGGVDGREVIDSYLSRTLVQCLSHTGLAYLVVLEANNTPDIVQRASRLGLQCNAVLSRKCGIEKLTVLRFKRSS